MKLLIDINSDMGEGTGADEALMPFVSSCNVSCGAHAGSPDEIQATVLAAVSRGLRVGAHPSYPDRENFGRRAMELVDDQLWETISDQVSHLKEVVEVAGGYLTHVKPHGALYADVMAGGRVAEVFLSAVQEIDRALVVFGMAGAPAAEVVAARGMTFVHEAFADRRYVSQLELRRREYEDAVIWDEAEAIAQVINIVKDHRVVLVSGETCPVTAQTICVHSDTPGATDLAAAIYTFLRESDVHIGLDL